MKLDGKIRFCATAAGALMLLCAVMVFWPFRFSYDSICLKCGAVRYTVEWQLPGSRYSFYSRSSIEDTALSRFLATSGQVTKHSHDWMFGQGGGNGVRCALGGGDHIRASVTSLAVVRLLEFSRKYGKAGEYDRLLGDVFNPSLSVAQAIRTVANDVPTDGFAGRQEYRTWSSQKAWIIDQGLEMAKENP